MFAYVAVGSYEEASEEVKKKKTMKERNHNEKGRENHVEEGRGGGHDNGVGMEKEKN